MPKIGVISIPNSSPPYDHHQMLSEEWHACNEETPTNGCNTSHGWHLWLDRELAERNKKSALSQVALSTHCFSSSLFLLAGTIKSNPSKGSKQEVRTVRGRVKKKMGCLGVLFLGLLSFSAVAFAENGEEDVRLVMNYYKDSCPQAEEIIREQVKLLYKRHKNTAFSWLRNIFHDCAVQSCDASLLLDSTRRSLSEKETDRSFGMRNFRYLDTIKEAVERECPETVSCADILVLSARDGIVAV